MTVELSIPLTVGAPILRDDAGGETPDPQVVVREFWE